MRANIDKNSNIFLLPKNRAIVASYVYTSATRKCFVYRMIMEKRMERVLQKKIFTFHKMRANWLWYFPKLFDKRTMECRFHTKI